MTDTFTTLSVLDSSLRTDAQPSQLTPDLLLRVTPILLFNRRGDRLHCFSSHETAIAYLRAAMNR